MKLKTVIAPSMPEAMRQVKEALGVDAVILSSLEGDDGQVRVTAALEDDPMDAGPLDGAGVGGGGLDGPRQIERIQAALRFHRVPDRLVDRLTVQAGGLGGENATMALAGALDSELRFADDRFAGTSRRLLLAGAPGAGKTATAAKLCARARLAGLTPALISLDTEKAGGQEQIATFAEALEVPFQPASDGPSMIQALGKLPESDLVVIDTPGLDPFDPDALARTAGWSSKLRAECLLVLPAGLDTLESAETAQVFAEIGAAGLVATKLDVARRIGGLLAAAEASGLALVAGGVAPTIADGLTPLNPVALARLLLPASKSGFDAAPFPALATGTQS